MRFSIEKKLLISHYLMGEPSSTLCAEKQIASSAFYSWAKLYQPIPRNTLTPSLYRNISFKKGVQKNWVILSRY